MRQMIFRTAVLLILAAMLLGVSGCEGTDCTLCGFTPMTQVQLDYTNTDGQQVSMVGWTDANGCITAHSCQDAEYVMP